jgi:hypothetical protein
MFERKGEEEVCETCGTAKVFFVQHAHGNYPLLDFLCPKCEVGEGETYGDGLEDSP